MIRPIRPRTVLLGALIALAAVVIAVTVISLQIVDTGPGTAALQYSQALDSRDLAAANSLLSSDSIPWPLNTPATQLGARCVDPTVAQNSVIAMLATVTLRCTNRSRGPIYIVVQEAETWRVRRLR